MKIDTLVSDLSNSLVNEVVAAVGLPITQFTHSLFKLAFRRITDRLANLGAIFDRISKEKGLPAASAWGLSHFCNGFHIQGAERIPEKGPLLVVSNHPGTYDSLVLFSNLIGHEIRSMANLIPFLNTLPNARQYFLFTPRNDVKERMLALRGAIRHLRSGGAVVFFGSGHRDPDPAVYPGAEKKIDQWLNIFDTFLQYVKGLQILPVIISGVISEKWVHHPITRLRKKQIDQQRLAEFGQVISQLRKPGRLMLNPRISFGFPFTKEELGQAKVHLAVVERVKALFRESRDYFGGFAP